MRKYYVSILVLTGLLVGAGVAGAQMRAGLNVSATTSVDAKPMRAQVKTQVNAEFKTHLEARQKALEAQRLKMKAAIEARLKVANEQGDEMQARHEAMKLEMEKKRADADARREALRVEAEAKRADMQAKRQEFREDVAKRAVANTVRVMRAAIERLENIATRIESRIEKIRGRGGNTSEAEGFVAKARASLSDAKAALEVFASIDLSATLAEERFNLIRAAAATVREHLRAARENLVLAIRSLGSIELDLGATATSTSEVNN